jgi:hypothetical protein
MMTALEKARERGTACGTADGGTLFGPNATREMAQEYLDLAAAGDLAFYDDVPCSPLSGEFAGDYSLADLARDTGIAQDDDGFGEVMDAFDEAFDAAVREQVLADARAIVERAS